MNCQAYTLSEKINIWRAKAFLRSSTGLYKELIDTDLSNTVTELEIPVYFLAGRYDYTVNYDLQKNYFDKINAPKKVFTHLKTLLTARCLKNRNALSR
jgi:hypothetical protein